MAHRQEPTVPLGLRPEPDSGLGHSASVRLRGGTAEYTAYQRKVLAAYVGHGPKHKLIAWKIGSTAGSVRRMLRNVAAKGGLPERYEWPVQR